MNWWKRFRKECKHSFKRSRYDSYSHTGRRVDGCRLTNISCKKMNCPLLEHEAGP